MGCKVSSCFTIKAEPKRNHIKKIKDIYANYLQSKPKDSAAKGVEQLSGEMVESIERYTKGAAKDLCHIMELDRTKIPSVCKILKEKKFDNATVSAELRYLTLSLLKDIMLTPLESQ